MTTEKIHIRKRMTQEQYDDLYNRRRKVRDLAAELGVSESYLSSAIPERAPKRNYKLLKATRQLYRLQVARECVAGRWSVKEAAEKISACERTVFRLMAIVKKEVASGKPE